VPPGEQVKYFRHTFFNEADDVDQMRELEDDSRTVGCWVACACCDEKVFCRKENSGHTV
jgi:hypothetical protein